MISEKVCAMGESVRLHFFGVVGLYPYPCLAYNHSTVCRRQLLPLPIEVYTLIFFVVQKYFFSEKMLENNFLTMSITSLKSAPTRYHQ